jgi:hypothetical protein
MIFISSGRTSNNFPISNVTFSNNIIYNINTLLKYYNSITSLSVNNNSYINPLVGNDVVGYLISITDPISDISHTSWNVYDNYSNGIQATILLNGNSFDYNTSDFNVYNNEAINCDSLLQIIAVSVSSWNVYDNEGKNVGSGNDAIFTHSFNDPTEPNYADVKCKIIYDHRKFIVIAE